jgi:hypothetical protein
MHRKTAAEKLRDKAEKAARDHVKAQRRLIKERQKRDRRTIREHRQRVRRERLEQRLNAKVQGKKR